MPELAWWMLAAAGGLLGLLIGSFLNVVIYRLPKMMERQWAAECAALAAGQPAAADAPAGSFNLLTPRSRCQQCGHQIRWFENIPVISYLFLRGRCSSCKARISLRYPVVELVTAAFFALCAARWCLSWQAAGWAVFASLLICMFLIDMDTTLLPDDLTLPLLWIGLIASMSGWTRVPLPDAVWGAIGGYLSLWLVYWAFKLATGKEGFGYGDFKLLAALGAWLGVKYLLAIILLSTCVGAVIGLVLLLRGKLADHTMPFGPYLAGAGLLCFALEPATLPALLPIAFPFGTP